MIFHVVCITAFVPKELATMKVISLAILCHFFLIVSTVEIFFFHQFRASGNDVKKLSLVVLYSFHLTPAVNLITTNFATGVSLHCSLSWLRRDMEHGLEHACLSHQQKPKF